MNRRLIYIISLMGFILMGGVVGFAAVAPHSESGIQGTIPQEESSPIPAGTMVSPAIPVTGDAQPESGIFLTYGFFGVGALILIMILLSAANKATIPDLGGRKPLNKP